MKFEGENDVLFPCTLRKDGQLFQGLWLLLPPLISLTPAALVTPAVMWIGQILVLVKTLLFSGLRLQRVLAGMVRFWLCALFCKQNLLPI